MIRHDSFTLTRTIEGPPSSVFQLFADESRWRRWFRLPGSGATYVHDFRVGGADHATSELRMPDGRVERVENRATYLAIETDRRVVFAYTAIVDDVPRWSALVTVELSPGGTGTELSWTEQVALLVTSDGTGDVDLAHLRGGTRLRLNALNGALLPT